MRPPAMRAVDSTWLGCLDLDRLFVEIRPAATAR